MREKFPLTKDDFFNQSEYDQYLQDSTAEFFDYLDNYLLIVGLKEFKAFIEIEKKKAEERLVEHFGKSLVSYTSGLDVKIYSAILDGILARENEVLYNIDYFRDKKNFPNQVLVSEIIGYFEEQDGKRAFTSLRFLNLLQKQLEFVVSNITATEKVISHLKGLPLNDLEKHILLGFILKWFGGYPIQNFNVDFKTTLGELEKDFLAFPEDTPEKQFCKTDYKEGKRFKRLSIAFTESTNSGVNAAKLYQDVNVDNQSGQGYTSFDNLFEDAIYYDAIPKQTNEVVKINLKSIYNLHFNEWLLENKGWDPDNENQYYSFLTKENFLEFLKVHKQREKEEVINQKLKHDMEKASWNVLEGTIEMAYLPDSFNLNAPFEERVAVCAAHNGEILKRYEDGLSGSRQTLDKLTKELMTAIKEGISQSDAGRLERQLNQLKSGFMSNMLDEIDLGCIINGVPNTAIENSFKKLQDFWKNSIVVIDQHLKTLVGLVRRDIDEATKVSSLKQNNKLFERLKSELDTKIQVSSLGIKESEFIQAEIERVDRNYSKPYVNVSAPGAEITARFDYSEYTRRAFEWLSKGFDYPLKEIVKGAKKNAPLEIVKMDEFEQAVIDNLANGVGWFLYRGYLLDRQYSVVVKSSESIVPNRKFSAKYHALAYIMDCKATDTPLYNGNKKELEKEGRKRLPESNGNTFYKLFNELCGKDLRNEKNLIDIAGENWQTIIMELSKAPDRLLRYLQANY